MAAMKQRKLNIKEDWARREWREIVNDAQFTKEFRLQRLEKVERELSAPSQVEFGAYITGCGSLSFLNAKLGIQEFAASRIEDGWKLISEGLIYKLTEFKIQFAMGFPCAYSGVFREAALVFATAIAIGSKEVRDWLAPFILETEANLKSKLRPKEPDEFEYLCLLLAAEVCGVSSKQVWRDAMDASFYAPLWNATSAEEVQTALGPIAITRAKLCLESLCDYPPFEWPPFNLFPMEILAVLQMRKFDHLQFDFGGIESPLCHPPSELTWEKPAIIARVEARVRELYNYPTIEWK